MDLWKQDEGTKLRPAFGRLAWDVYLAKGTDLKRDLLKDKKANPVQLEETLTADLPKYVWRAVAYMKMHPKLN
ncbi:MAG: hypothetical protein WDM89_22365, partial [Rhizomicrobium sp.]